MYEKLVPFSFDVTVLNCLKRNDKIVILKEYKTQGINKEFTHGLYYYINDTNMKSIFTTVLIITAVVSCNNVNSSSNETSSNTSDTLNHETQPPVETKKANTDFEPAFEGQTRIAGIKTSTAYEGTVITKSLNSPWGIVALPDGRLLITENKGNMRIVDPSNGQMGEGITGIPEVDDRGQGGLLGLTLAPEFSSNRMVYWAFTERVETGNHTAVAKGRLAEDEKTIENAQVIYRLTPTYDGNKHYGGRVIFNENGDLFVSI